MSWLSRRRPGLDALQRTWEAHWEGALQSWSRFTKLSAPRWCLTVDDERREKLSGSFAMIRLTDQAVVIGLRQIREAGLEAFGLPILAHEVGHHVYAPGDLRDQARLLARLRHALPTREGFAGLVANLYTDLLVNDRLQRGAGVDLAGVYRILKPEPRKVDRLWALYLRLCERLWGLSRGELVDFADDERLRLDADLGARVVRAYARDWLRGAGRFGTLLLPYLLEAEPAAPPLAWLDTAAAAEGAPVPDGLAELDEDEEDGAIHPVEDPELSGMGPEEAPPIAKGRETEGGRKNRYREPGSYVDLMKALGVKVTEKELVIRYYRERALPYLVPFPARLARPAADLLPEGLETWDLGSPVSQIDWPGTLTASPAVVPGLTTRERTYGATEGGEPRRLPLDLYVGIDCSGSMRNPAASLSCPVLAGSVVALSALRSGARVMACLSGEPGEYAQTEGFVRSPPAILGVLTGYLGTGYAFGVERLRAAFLEAPPLARPAHLLVVSDSDLFRMLEEVRDGWEVARRAALAAGGGATAVLQLDPAGWSAQLDRLAAAGWTVHAVRSLEELVAFARAFARNRYGPPEEVGA